MSAKAVILVADDNPNNLQVASSMLNECGWQVRVAIDGDAALKSIELSPPDLVLLDINMPKMNGYDVCKVLKANPDTQSIPVIFATAVSEGFNKLKCFEVGGQDYLTKPLQLEELRSRIGVHIELASHVKHLRDVNQQLEDAISEVQQLKQYVNELSVELKRSQPYPESKGER